MLKWFHHLFNPHCKECKEEELQRLEFSGVCKSCETLKVQLEIANFEKKQLLDSILTKPTEESVSTQNFEPIKPRNVPWNVRRQMLEAESRREAELLRNAPKPSNEDLEKELGIEDASQVR